MGLFTKYREICGKKIDKGQDFVRFGRHFDSEEHAEQYAKMMETKRQSSQGQSDDCGSGCGCC
jgi:hypothetical protein